MQVQRQNSSKVLQNKKPNIISSIAPKEPKQALIPSGNPGLTGRDKYKNQAVPGVINTVCNCCLKRRTPTIISVLYFPHVPSAKRDKPTPGQNRCDVFEDGLNQTMPWKQRFLKCIFRIIPRMRFYLAPARRLLMESRGLCYNSGQTAVFCCRQEEPALFTASEAPPTNELHCSYKWYQKYS